MDEVKLRTQFLSSSFSGRALGYYHSDGIGDLGNFRWELVLCLLFCWIIVCLALIKGIKSSGKVSQIVFARKWPKQCLVIKKKA